MGVGSRSNRLSGGDSDESLYHGTFQNISGGQVLPPDSTGARSKGFINGDGFDKGFNDRNAFATNREDYAWSYTMDTDKGRGHVYKVEPNPDQHEDAIGGEVTAPSFKIKDKIDIQPPDTLNGRTSRQGTLPDINWNNYSTHRSSPDMMTQGMDRNHRHLTEDMDPVHKMSKIDYLGGERTFPARNQGNSPKLPHFEEGQHSQMRLF